MENVPALEDGLYFGLSEDVYHRLPMVSAHNVKDLLISPLDYWENSNLNPAPDEEDNEDTFARILGRAYHTRILEGREAFVACYAAKFVCPDDALDTNDELKEACKKLSLAVGGKKQDLIDRLLVADPSLIIKAVLEHDYYEQNAGKQFLDARSLNRIERAALMIEKHPQVSKCFTGGYPEVTVIFTKDGIRRRSRLDYLKPAAIVDLKSFANRRRKPVKEAIILSMAEEKHHIQAEYYIEAARAAAEHARNGKVFNLGDFHTQPDEDFLRLLAERKEDHEFWFVFQQTGKAPVALGLKFECPNMRGAARYHIEAAMEVYRVHFERHGDQGEPWVDATPLDQFYDEDFPPWAA